MTARARDLGSVTTRRLVLVTGRAGLHDLALVRLVAALALLVTLRRGREFGLVARRARGLRELRCVRGGLVAAIARGVALGDDDGLRVARGAWLHRACWFVRRGLV